MKAIPFMKWRWVAMALSAIALLAAIGSLSVRQLNWGLDFTGGTLVEVAYSDSADWERFARCWIRRGTRAPWWSVLVPTKMYLYACLTATRMSRAH